MCDNFKTYSNKNVVKFLFFGISIIWLSFILYIIAFFDFYSDYFLWIYPLIFSFFLITYLFFNINILEIRVTQLALHTYTTNYLFYLFGKKYTVFNEFDFKFIKQLEVKPCFPAHIKMSLKYIDKTVRISLILFCKKDIKNLEKEIFDNPYYKSLNDG